mmetsp:Transcript_23741/g.62025  ORF Transcript_23741/g.62025 Transcript_23741/m.62025 type:complete len:365 (-) Transcript_23741:281-1375(-)
MLRHGADPPRRPRPSERAQLVEEAGRVHQIPLGLDLADAGPFGLPQVVVAVSPLRETVRLPLCGALGGRRRRVGGDHPARASLANGLALEGVRRQVAIGRVQILEAPRGAPERGGALGAAVLGGRRVHLLNPDVRHVEERVGLGRGGAARGGHRGDVLRDSPDAAGRRDRLRVLGVKHLEDGRRGVPPKRVCHRAKSGPPGDLLKGGGLEGGPVGRVAVPLRQPAAANKRAAAGSVVHEVVLVKRIRGHVDLAVPGEGRLEVLLLARVAHVEGLAEVEELGHLQPNQVGLPELALHPDEVHFGVGLGQVLRHPPDPHPVEPCDRRDVAVGPSPRRDYEGSHHNRVGPAVNHAVGVARGVRLEHP